MPEPHASIFFWARRQEEARAGAALCTEMSQSHKHTFMATSVYIRDVKTFLAGVVHLFFPPTPLLDNRIIVFVVVKCYIFDKYYEKTWNYKKKSMGAAATLV